jgi:hypothetical protein
MSDINRILALAGMSPKKDLLKELKTARDELTSAHNQVIKQVEAGVQLDEGLFASLKAALATATQVGASGAKAAADKARKLAEPIKQLYLDNKAREELKVLTHTLADVISAFEKAETKATTILKRDAEVASEVKLFKDLLQKTLESFAARLQIQVEGLEDDDIRDLMIEQGFLLDLLSAEELVEAKVGDEVLQQVKDSQEFKDLTAEFKFVSTKRNLNNGTLVFDIGLPQIDVTGEPIKSTSYLLKAYADGQVRAQIKGNQKTYDGIDIAPSHYRVGKKFVSTTDDQVVLYRAMLKDILVRAKKKVANHAKAVAAQKEAFSKLQQATVQHNFGTDAEPDDSVKS